MDEPTELKALLIGISEESERQAVTNAYYKLSSGDPNSFPVLFALVVKASALANQHYAKTIQKVADTTTDGTIYNMLEEVQQKLATLDETLEKINMGEMASLISSKFPSLKGMKEIAGELKIAVSNIPRAGTAKQNNKGLKSGVLLFFLILNLGATLYLIFKLTF